MELILTEASSFITVTLGNYTNPEKLRAWSRAQNILKPSWGLPSKTANHKVMSFLTENISNASTYLSLQDFPSGPVVTICFAVPGTQAWSLARNYTPHAARHPSLHATAENQRTAAKDAACCRPHSLRLSWCSQINRCMLKNFTCISKDTAKNSQRLDITANILKKSKTLHKIKRAIFFPTHITHS